jgi:predicted dinucleotide-binding enzyme
MVYCGDTQTGKDIAATLIRDVGFDPIDAGPLRMAHTEPLAVLVAQLAYGGTEGPQTSVSVRAVWAKRMIK